MWRPCAESCNRRDNGGNAGLADCYPRRDSERSYSHTNANHCCERSGTSGGRAHSHANCYFDGGADQTANTGAHGHANRYSDVGADQTPNTGARSHSNRYSDVGADQTANTGTHSHASGLTPLRDFDNGPWVEQSAPQLASSIKELSWLRDGITSTETGVIQNLLYIAVVSRPVASAIVSLDWVQDGVDDVEAGAIDWMNNFGDAEVASAVASLGWL